MLYSCNLDGTNEKRLLEGPLSFCIYKNIMYYVEGAGNYSGDAFIYDFENEKIKGIGIVSNYNFAMAYDRLIPQDDFPIDDFKVYNIDSDIIGNFPLKEHYSLGSCGQYVFNCYFPDEDTMWVYAYDILTDRNYSLINITDIGSCTFYAGPEEYLYRKKNK